MIRFYDNYVKDPNSIEQGELQQAKTLALRIKEHCEYYNIDYKDILPEEVRKFY